jgi:hypothetical protein
MGWGLCRGAMWMPLGGCLGEAVFQLAETLQYLGAALSKLLDTC